MCGLGFRAQDSGLRAQRVGGRGRDEGLVAALSWALRIV